MEQNEVGEEHRVYVTGFAKTDRIVTTAEIQLKIATFSHCPGIPAYQL